MGNNLMALSDVAVQGPVLAMTTMPSLGNISSYVRQVNLIPMLEPERELECVAALRDTGSLEAAKELVLSHLRLVVKIAREHSGYGLQQEDLIQEGNVGLMLAVKKFDPSRGVRLAAYAAIWIRSEIQEYVLSNWRIVKIGSAKGLKKLFFNLRRLQEELHGMSRLRQKQEIAALLSVEEDEVERAVQWFAGGETALLPSDGEREAGESGQVLLASDSTRPDYAIEASDWAKKLPGRISLAMESLSDREREVVHSRYLAGEASSTLAELALRLGVSIERVRQIEVGALKKMRDGSACLDNFRD
jgi:RNA polymerase sigma-32 factor